METPEGFTKVSTGKYTKGDYTYTVNGTTGEVTVSNGAEDGTSIAGTYRMLMAYLSKGDEDSAGQYMDYMKLYVENDDTFYVEIEGNTAITGTYAFNENTNKVTVNIEGENPEVWDCFRLENNIVLRDSEGAFFVSNGVAGIETTLDSTLEGTYTGENNIQAVISNSIITAQESDVNVGREICTIQLSGLGSSNYGTWIIKINNNIYAYGEPEFNLDTENNEVTINGYTLTKVNQ